jgi:CheY-like chemotaxis protein
MLVDDDTDDAYLFCEAISRIPSAECYTAENGLALFDQLSIQTIKNPDIIFLDINMPLMDGWECLKKLKSNAAYFSIPAIMYSTSAARKDIDMAYRLGANLFVTKPEDFSELTKILEIVATTPPGSLASELAGFKSVKTI